MNDDLQAVLLNGLPLLVLAALYLAVTAVLAPSLWRERAHVRDGDVALALLFPSIALTAGALGIAVVVEREPLAGHALLALAAIAVASVPPLAFLLARDRSLPIENAQRLAQAEAAGRNRERELETVRRVSGQLVRLDETGAIGRVLVDEVADLVGADTVALALVDEPSRTARYVAACHLGAAAEWLEGQQLPLEGETSGVAAAYRDGAPLTVYEAETSPIVSRRLAEQAGARSCAFLPVLARDRVVGVLVLATQTRRAFSFDELSVLQALVGEAALALERTTSAQELASALERERLVARIARDLRSRLDAQDVLEVAVAEVARALGVSRAYVRVGERIAAEWYAEGLGAVVDVASRLPVANRALAEARTIVVADVAREEWLDADERDVLARLGAGAVLATPMLTHGSPRGVLGVHRREPGAWNPGAVALVEAVAREAALAFSTAELLAANERRASEQSALVEAARVITSELRFETVIERLVDEAARLLDADAADCFLFERERRVLRCAAVHGLDPGLVGTELTPNQGLAGAAISTGRPVVAEEYDPGARRLAHPAYEGFVGAIVAPISWSGEVQGVLGAGTREQERRFSEADADVLDAFARLASLALRNAQAYEESTRRGQVQQGFARITSLLAEPLAVDATLDAIAQAAAEAFGAGSAAVVLPHPDPVVTGRHGLSAGLAELLADAAAAEPLAAAAAEHRTLVARDLAEDDRFDESWRAEAAAAGARALLAVPIEEPRAGRTSVVLVLDGRPRSFRDEDLELAQRLALAARAALERSALFEVERRSRSLAQQLAHTGRQLAVELDPGAIIDELVRQAPDLLGADGASVQVLERDELVVAAASGVGAGDALGERSPSTAWLAGDIVQTRRPVAVADVRGDDRAAEADPLLGTGRYGAYLGVALVAAEGGVHGVLAVYSARPREWRPEEIEALEALAASAGAALTNAELYQRVAIEKERSDAILANVADGIVALDREGRVVLWNPAAGRVTGVAAADALGRLPSEVIGRTFEGEGPRPGNRLVSIARAGEDVWLSLSEAVMTDPAGAVAGRIFAFRDISDERVVEEMKSEFVSTVSHELRSPLTSIYGFAETLLREDVAFGEEERRTFLRYIASESERLTAIVDTLLSVAQLDSGDMQVQLAPTDVAAVVTEAVRGIEQTHGSNGHVFVTELPAAPLRAEVDREKLRQILGILLDNAVRYSPEGGTVRIAAREDGETVELRVEDQGIGIPTAEHERIFRKFYRAEGVSRMTGTGSTGLGLFIAEGLVTAMGGRIWVESVEGEGATFAIELRAVRTEI